MDLRNDGCKTIEDEKVITNGDMKQDQSNQNGNDYLDLNTCDDITIVGAGSGGAYTAYKLRNKGLKISVYEQLNRVGGRLHSIPIPGKAFILLCKGTS